jgi:hypothetical protein
MKYRKKPVIIEAIKFTGENWEEIHKFLPSSFSGGEVRGGSLEKSYMLIYTLEGTMKAEIDDWIIKGIQGEFYPCKPDIFESTYEPVN